MEIELKRPGEEPTVVQLHLLEEWRKAGAMVAVVHSIHELEVVLRSLEVKDLFGEAI